MTNLVDRASHARNEHMTFRANMGVGRHGWLRLTPAYGVRLVRERIAHLPEGAVVTDPFSGTGTTPLAAAELGFRGQSVDVNPFLIWLGNMKVADYSRQILDDASAASLEVVERAAGMTRDCDLWQPNLHQIEKWWSPGALHALKALRAAIDEHQGQVRDLLDVALCRCLISCSSAAFNHQSMSFKPTSGEPVLFDVDDTTRTFVSFSTELAEIIASARYNLEGSAHVHHGDSRQGVPELQQADLVLTSPPYVNRMSYIRELRPYMYWLRLLDKASDAGDLDWRAIGGTWGTATSKLSKWQPRTETPVDEPMHAVCDKIRQDGGKNGPLLATYVHKYHHDMWMHFQSMAAQVKDHGRATYIIGNSTFYGHEVPAHEWYATMLRQTGFTNVTISIIRKRNSNKALYEYDVSGVRP